MDTDGFAPALFTWVHQSVRHPDAIPTEHECHALFARLRFGDGFVCPFCAHRRASHRHAHVWRCLGCRRRITVTTRTVLHGTRLPFRTWLAALWWVTCSPKGIPALRFQSLYGIGSYQTALLLLRKVRVFFPGDRRAHLAARPSSGTLQILGRHLPRNRAWLVLRVDERSLRFEVTAKRVEARSASPALLLLESFRAWIAGTFHGVWRRYLHLYATEFFGRFRDQQMPAMLGAHLVKVVSATVEA